MKGASLPINSAVVVMIAVFVAAIIITVVSTGVDDGVNRLNSLYKDNKASDLTESSWQPQKSNEIGEKTDNHIHKVREEFDIREQDAIYLSVIPNYLTSEEQLV